MNTQRLAVVSGKGLSILEIASGICRPNLYDETSVHEAVFDKSGRYICWCSSNGTFLFDFTSNTKVSLSSTNKFRKISFSPKGNFVTLFSLNYGNNTDDNVLCFKTSNGSLFHSYKYNNSGHWAPHWSADESICMRVHKSEVCFHTSQNMSTFNGKITLKGLESAALATCGSKYFVAVYVQGAQGMPHMVKIYQYPNLKEPINNRSFFKANDVYLHWSPSGKALLFLVHTEDTKTNYYGENSLYFMSSEIGGETAVVQLPKSETNVHNVDWQPVSGDKFVVTYGNPVAAAVFNTKCQMLYVIDSPNRNVCNFGNCGNILAMMGAGSVRSSIQLWNFASKKMFGELDIEDANKIAWSGNDKYLVSATVSPALRVNNGMIIWDIDGELIADKAACNKLIGEPTELYNVVWQPDPNHDQSHCIRRKGMFFFDDKVQKHKEKPVNNLNTSYVPPHLRNKGGDHGISNDGTKKIIYVGPSMKFTDDKPVPVSKPKKKKNKSKTTINNNEAAISPTL